MIYYIVGITPDGKAKGRLVELPDISHPHLFEITSMFDPGVDGTYSSERKQEIKKILDERVVGNAKWVAFLKREGEDATEDFKT